MYISPRGPSAPFRASVYSSLFWRDVVGVVVVVVVIFGVVVVGVGCCCVDGRGTKVVVVIVVPRDNAYSAVAFLR
jgi:hypothetical protein